MQASGEHSINIQRFRNQVAAQSHDGALRFYYKELDRPLYCSGENLTIVELLEALLDSENIPIHSISHDLQERLCRTLGAAYQVTGRPHRSMHILRWSLSSAESSDSPRTKAIILRYLSRIALSLGQLKAAEDFIMSGIAACQEAGEVGLETGLRRQLGVLWAYEGQYDKARVEIDHLPKGFGKHNHSDFSVYADKFLFGLQDDGESNKIVFYANEMKKLARKYRFKNDETMAEWSLGSAYLAARDIGKAEHYLASALALCRVTTYIELEPDILLLTARCSLARDKALLSG